MAELQEFHYAAVLRQLELEAGRLKEWAQKSAERQPVERLMKVFGLAIQKLAQVRVSTGAKISLNLKFSREKQERIEAEIIANLRRLTEEPASAGEWPPRIPIDRIIERFTGTVIGLHSDNTHGNFATSITTAFEKAVLPALAWGLMIRLYELPEELRVATKAKLVERLLDETTPNSTVVALGGEAYRKVSLPYLRLVEAWFKLLGDGKICAVPSAQRARLRRTLAERFRLPLSELDTLLWQELGGLYVTTLAGSERARAITLAGGNAAFMRERLALFGAATRAENQDFRLLTEHRLDEAVQKAFVCELENPPAREAAGLEACGAAFWLARASFGRHGHPHADAASARTLLLLLRAAVMLRGQADLVATCLRYAAGFATNPRYTRSGLVIDFQAKLVELYARNPLARKALVAQFRGRIAWQQWKAGDNAAKVRTLDHYRLALELHDRGFDGLDSEGPVHFFPELIVLLGQADTGRRAQEDLATVDFITQRNYGIYFDIEKEERLIEAGLKEFKRRKTDIEDHQAKVTTQRDMRVAAAEAAEKESLESGMEPAQIDGGSNWNVLSQSADYKLCGTLIAELRTGAAN